MAVLDFNRIIKVDFPENQYYNETVEKNQIVLHHTVSSSSNADGDIGTWEGDPVRVATCVIITKDGKIHQLYKSNKWAYHLGVKTSNSVSLNKHSIGIEIDNIGGLVLKNDGKYYNYYGYPENPNKKEIIKLDIPFRGYTYFEKYSSEQIESIRQLLLYWNEIYGIPLTYNPNIWDLTQDALTGVPGVYSHVSYRKDKSDAYPDPDLIQMLSSL